MNINYQYTTPGKIDISGYTPIRDIIGYFYTSIHAGGKLFLSSKNLHWEVIEQTDNNLFIIGFDSSKLFEQTWNISKTSDDHLEIDIDITIHQYIEIDYAYACLTCAPSFWYFHNSYTSGVFPAHQANTNQTIWSGNPEKEGLQIGTGITGAPIIHINSSDGFIYSSVKLAANGINKRNEVRYHRIDNHFGRVQWHPGKYKFFHGSINLVSDTGWMTEDDSFFSKLNSPKKILLINSVNQGFSLYFPNILKNRFPGCEVINVLQNIEDDHIGNIGISYPALSELSFKEKLIQFNTIRKTVKIKKPDVTIVFFSNLEEEPNIWIMILGGSLTFHKGYLLDSSKREKTLNGLSQLILINISYWLFNILKLCFKKAWALTRILLIPFELIGLILVFIWLFTIESYYSLKGKRHKTH